ncbi:MAG: plasmid stabilization protein [Cyanobacteria bacterium K_Offshore_surface_m2_239]|nr:plasmid stabilization protein [Cyanobacteria bacterium K_Offshore_surface_m2_239]
MREAYRQTMALLETNPYYRSLCLYALRGRLQGLHSVSINLSTRITLEVLIEGQTLIPIDIGSHDAMYPA